MVIESLAPYVLIFILGACLGSFLNVCIYRLPLEQSVLHNGSHCPTCGKYLKIIDLIPMLSYMFLKGHCRYCKCTISPQYPIVELVTALLCTSAYGLWGKQWHTLAMVVFFAVLITAALIDLKEGIIPDEIILTGILLGAPLILLSGVLINGLLGFTCAGLFFLLIAYLSRGGMGGGDIKLAALMGFYLGTPNIIAAVFISFITGGVASLILLAQKRKGMKDPLPFGPFLVLGGITASFGAETMINWYINFAF